MPKPGRKQIIRERTKRAEEINELILSIATNGRQFFCHEGVSSWMEVDSRGRIWFVNAYRGDETYTHYHGYWRKFHHGGTLKGLVQCFREYILRGTLLPRSCFWWPDWIQNGDLWGYGNDIEPVRQTAENLGLLKPRTT